jgi:hypothetical protein
MSCTGTANGAAQNVATRDVSVIYGDLDATNYAALDASGSDLLVSGNVVLDGASSVDDKGIIAVGGDLHVTSAALTTLSLPSLTAIGRSLTLTGNTSLVTVTLTALAHAGAVDIENNPALTGVSAPQLARVDGDFVLEGNASASLGFRLEDLARVGGNLDVTNNPGLASSSAAALVQQIEDAGFGVGGTVTVAGNGT